MKNIMTRNLKRKSKIIVIQGPPASGKSTLAKYLHKQNIENSIIVSRDAIRESLGTYWVESREPLVKQIEENIVKSSLTLGYDVIIDNTNMDWLKNKNWKWIAELYEADIEFKHCYLPKESLKKRNLCKDRPVPEEFIDEFFEKYEDIMKEWDEYKSYHRYSDDEWDSMNYEGQINYELY